MVPLSRQLVTSSDFLRQLLLRSQQQLLLHYNQYDYHQR